MPLSLPLTLPRMPELSAPSSGGLLDQSVALLNEYLPSPLPLLGGIDRRLPLAIKRKAVEPSLNRLFQEAIEDGDFDGFEDRRIRLEVTGGHPGLTLGFQDNRLRVLTGPGEATIRGSLAAFKTLAERKQDPDQLFFQRRLVIEGDTELGLAVKNLLDSLEWDINLKQLLFQSG